LYLNGPMRKAAAKDVGDRIEMSIEFDAAPPVLVMHPSLEQALAVSQQAERAFTALAPSKKKEILRYLAGLKSAASVVRNVEAVIAELVAAPGRQTPAFMRPASRQSAKSSSG
jgi:hypothetical protein